MSDSTIPIPEGWEEIPHDYRNVEFGNKVWCPPTEGHWLELSSDVIQNFRPWPIKPTDTQIFIQKSILKRTN